MPTPLLPDDPHQLDDLELTGRLGEGGQGIVYLGRRPSGEPVAVKILKSGADPAARVRLTRELDALRTVASFCTARVLGASVEGSQPYVVSEYVNGPSLQDRIIQQGPLPEGDLERLFIGTITALVAIHSAGVVHRDFKPGNVLLGPDGPRVVDFGIARPEQAATITSGLIGTPAYLSPEQIAGSPASPASDVFAWGVTMVYAATGRPSFGDDSVHAVLNRVLHHEADVSGVPERLRPIVTDALVKDPAQRPSARTLLMRLVDPTAPPEGLPARTMADMGAAPLAAPPPSAAPPGPPQPPATAPHQQATMQQPPGMMHAPAQTHPGAPRKSSRGKILAGVAGVVVLTAAAATIPFLLMRDDGEPENGKTSPPVAQSNPQTSSSPNLNVPLPFQTSPAVQPSASIPASYAGNWKGKIKSSLQDKTYDITIKLASGSKTGQWEEPANNCSGTLAVTKASDASLETRLQNLTNQCVPGNVTLTKQGDALGYRWADDAGLQNYTGNLSRS